MKRSSIAKAGLIITLLTADITIAAPTAIPTYNCIGLYWDGVGGASTACSTFYRIKGTSTWNRAQNLWWDDRPASDWHGDEYRGSIAGLQPATIYDIRLKLSSGPEETISAATWTEVEQRPIASTVAVESQASGYTINQSGSPNGYILYDGTDAVISGGDAPGVTISASYVILRGLTIRDVGRYGIDLQNCTDVIIDNCDISKWGTLHTNFQREDDSGIRAQTDLIARITIQNCRIHHPRYDANNWKELRDGSTSSMHPNGANAIELDSRDHDKSGNHVIRRNHIWSDYDHMFNDGMGQDHNMSYDGFPIRDSDIHDNVVSHVWDDGLEIEGANMNVRVWGNTVDSCAVAYGLAVTSTGPLYVFRNVGGWALAYPNRGSGWGMFKLGNEDPDIGYGPIFLYHNTMLQPDSHGLDNGVNPTGTGKIQHHVFTRNNILHVRKNSINAPGGLDVNLPGSSFDYDLCSGGVPSGTESNGLLNKEPVYKAGTDTLHSSSPGYDAGVVLWNFNDKSSAWPYDGTAPDMGAVETNQGGITDVRNDMLHSNKADVSLSINASKLFFDVRGRRVWPDAHRQKLILAVSPAGSSRFVLRF